MRMTCIADTIEPNIIPPNMNIYIQLYVHRFLQSVSCSGQVILVSSVSSVGRARTGAKDAGVSGSIPGVANLKIKLSDQFTQL